MVVVLSNVNIAAGLKKLDYLLTHNCSSGCCKIKPW